MRPGALIGPQDVPHPTKHPLLTLGIREKILSYLSPKEIALFDRVSKCATKDHLWQSIALREGHKEKYKDYSWKKFYRLLKEKNYFLKPPKERLVIVAARVCGFSLILGLGVYFLYRQPIISFLVATLLGAACLAHQSDVKKFEERSRRFAKLMHAPRAVAFNNNMVKIYRAKPAKLRKMQAREALRQLGLEDAKVF